MPQLLAPSYYDGFALATTAARRRWSGLAADVQCLGRYFQAARATAFWQREHNHARAEFYVDDSHFAEGPQRLGNSRYYCDIAKWFGMHRMPDATMDHAGGKSSNDSKYWLQRRWAENGDLVAPESPPPPEDHPEDLSVKQTNILAVLAKVHEKDLPICRSTFTNSFRCWNS